MRTFLSKLLPMVILAGAGRAEAGPIGAAPPSLNFGNVGVGAPPAKLTVTLTNNGNAVVAVTSVMVNGANAADFTATPSLAPPLNLAVGATLTVDVTFAPQAGGSRVGTLTVATGGGVGNTDVPLSGVGLGPKIAVTPSPIGAGGTKVNVTTNTKVTVTNSGGGTISVKSLALSGPEAGSFALSAVPNLPANLGAGQSFAATLAFTPLSQGTHTATLTVTSDDPNTPSLAVAIKGTCGDPAITTDAGTVAFGNARVGLTSPAQTITATNSGNSDLHLTMVTIDGNNAGDFLLTPVMPATVVPGGTLPIKLQFKPSAVGARSARLVIVSDDPNSPSKFATLLGNGTFSMLSVAPPTVDFGMQPVLVASKPQAITLTNAGDAAANVVGISFGGMAGSWFRTAGIVVPPVVIPAMGKATVDIVALPLGLGAGAATVTFTTDEPKTPSFEVPLAVIATGGATVVDPAFVEFGLVPVLAKKTQTVTVSNNGTGDLSITTIDLVTKDAQFAIDKLPMSLPVMLPAGQKMSFDVICAPMIQGALTAEVDLQLEGDPKVRTLHVPVDCVGAVSGMMVTPLTLNFPAQLVGVTAVPQLVTVTNTGTASLSFTSVALSGANPNQFSFEDPGKIELAPSRSRIIPVSCAPTGAGTFTASLVIAAGTLPQTQVKLSCSALAATLMAGAGQTSIDFGDIPVGISSDVREIALRAGMVAVVITGITASDPAFVVDESALKRSLAAGATTSFKLAFAPAAAGTRTGNVTVFVNGGKMPAVTIRATGNGIGTTVTSMVKDPGGCAVGGGARAGTGVVLLAVVLLLVVRRRSRRTQAV